jgi:hypothetical protein
MWKIALGLVAAAALTLPTTQAQAGAACNKRAEVIAELSQKFEEAPVAIGLASNGSLVEVLTSRDGTTWTIIQTAPTGIACLVAAGEGWQPRQAQFASADPQI